MSKHGETSGGAAKHVTGGCRQAWQSIALVLQDNDYCKIWNYFVGRCTRILSEHTKLSSHVSKSKQFSSSHENIDILQTAQNFSDVTLDNDDFKRFGTHRIILLCLDRKNQICQTFNFQHHVEIPLSAMNSPMIQESSTYMMCLICRYVHNRFICYQTCTVKRPSQRKERSLIYFIFLIVSK